MAQTSYPLPFTKLQGLGNDFVLIDAIQHPLALSPTLIRQMSDRHFGIGFDQLLLIESPKQPNVDFTYRIFNADGEEVSQCGNGARCVGYYLWKKGLTHKKTIILGTQDRQLEISQQSEDAIRVNMGIPLLEPSQIPLQTKQIQTTYSLNIDGENLIFGAVNLGNPHAVLQVPDVQKAPVSTLGPTLQQHPAFPLQVNVGFMQVINRKHIRLRVYERGAGETLACGSGAAAAVVVGQLQGLLDAEVTVELTGGLLTIDWRGHAQPIWMTGPAAIVFTGEWLQ